MDKVHTNHQTPQLAKKFGQSKPPSEGYGRRSGEYSRGPSMDDERPNPSDLYNDDEEVHQPPAESPTCQSHVDEPQTGIPVQEPSKF